MAIILEEEVHRLLPGRAILISRYRQDMCLGGRNFPVQYCLPAAVINCYGLCPWAGIAGAYRACIVKNPGTGIIYICLNVIVQ